MFLGMAIYDSLQLVGINCVILSTFIFAMGERTYSPPDKHLGLIFAKRN